MFMDSGAWFICQYLSPLLCCFSLLAGRGICVRVRRVHVGVSVRVWVYLISYTHTHTYIYIYTYYTHIPHILIFIHITPATK